MIRTNLRVLVPTSIFAGMAAIVLCFGIQGSAMSQASSKPDTPIPNPNAFDTLGLAYSQFQDLDAITGAFTGIPDSKNQQTVIDKIGVTQATEIVAENQVAYATLRQALQQQYAAPPAHTLAATFPYLAHDRAMARALSFDALLKERQGDWTGAMEDSLDALQMADLLASHGLLVHDLVSIACAAIGRRAAWVALDNLPYSDSMSAERRLETIISNRTPLFLTMANDQKCAETSITDLDSDPRTVDDSQILAMYDRYMARREATAKLPYPAAKAAGDPPLPTDSVAGTLPPPPSTLIFRAVQDLTFDRLLMTSLALRAYSLDHQGTYPASLTELTPKYMTKLPIDPFGNGTAPLVYRNTGTSYLLYSIGPDGKDNGGAPFIHTNKDGTLTQRYCVPDDTGDIVAGVNYG